LSAAPRYDFSGCALRASTTSIEKSIASGLWARTTEKRELREEVVFLKKKDAVLTWLVEKE